MLRLICHWTSVLLLLAVGSAIAGCASKDDVSLADVETQAFEDLRNEIREVIDDPAREGEVIAMVDSLVGDLNDLRDKISTRTKRVRQLNADYDTTRADFESFFDQIDKEIHANKRQVSERQRALFEIITPDERSALSKAHSKAMDAAVRSMQAI